MKKLKTRSVWLVLDRNGWTVQAFTSLPAATDRERELNAKQPAHKAAPYHVVRGDYDWPGL